MTKCGEWRLVTGGEMGTEAGVETQTAWDDLRPAATLLVLIHEMVHC